MRWKHDLRSRIAILVAGFAIILAHGDSSAQTMSADEVVGAMRASLMQISSIEASYCVTVESMGKPDAQKGPNGQDIEYQYAWGYVPRDDAEYLDGKWAVDNKESIAYEDNHVVFNGSELRACTTSGNGGRIHGERSGMFTTWLTPRSFCGHDFLGLPSRHVADVLEGAELLDSEGAEEGLFVLQKPTLVGEEKWSLTVWIDPKHGFLPKRMEARKTLFDIVMRRTEVDEFLEVKPGIWIPVIGRMANFTVTEPETIDGRYSNGMTYEEIDALPEEELYKSVPTLGFIQTPLGRGEQTLIADKSSVRVNEEISGKSFTLEFQDGMWVWDDLNEMGYRVGRWDDPAVSTFPAIEPDEPESSSRSMLLWVTASTVLLLVLACPFFFIRVRRLKKA